MSIVGRDMGVSHTASIIAPFKTNFLEYADLDKR
ncbi:MAG: hypothetical protein BWY28_03226 [bacterium ADurb.Bin236]|nr:MAG: hypothetical protein BWY28_03226 [bacterium ADurb.Bin236]